MLRKKDFIQKSISDMALETITVKKLIKIWKYV